MIWLRIMKFAAMRGVGEMIVVVILNSATPTQPDSERIQRNDLLHEVRGDIEDV